MKEHQVIAETRQTEYRHVLRSLQEQGPAGVVVLGEMGMGKTSLVRAALAGAGITMPTLSLYCTPTLRAVPYGVLSPYLAALDTIDEPVSILRELNRIFGSHEEARNPNIVLIEDAHYLDSQTCFLLSLLIENTDVKIFALGDSDLDMDSPLSTLAQLESFTSLQLQPLNDSGVKAVAESVIGRTLGSGTVQVIAQVTAGNPRLVQAYSSACMEQGLLFHDDTLPQEHEIHEPVWVVTQELPKVDSRLQTLGREFSRYLSEPEQDTRILLALAGAQPTELLEACGLPYRRMVKSGQLLCKENTVSLTSVLIQEITRSMASEQTNARLHELWHATSVALGIKPTAREILWCLDIGESVTTEVVMAAAQECIAELDFESALRLCALSKISESGERGALLEAQILFYMGRLISARSLLLRITSKIKGLDLLGQTYALLMEVSTCIEANSAELEEILADWGSQTTKYSQGSDTEEYRILHEAGSKAVRLWLRVNSSTGTVPAVSEIQDLLADTQLPERVRFVSQVMLTDALSSKGLCQQALDILDPLEELLSKQADLRARYSVRVFFRKAWNMLFLGEYDKASAYIDSHRRKPLQSIQYYQGAISFLDGVKHLLQGREHLGASKVAQAVTELRILDTAQILGLSMNVYRVILKRLDISVPKAQSSSPLGHGSSGIISATGELGEESSAQRILARGFAASLGQPYPGESMSDFPLVNRECFFTTSRQLSDPELGESALREELLDLASNQEGARPQLMARLVQLRHGAEREPLEDLAQEALAKKEYLVVIEAWARAAQRYAESGDQRRCGALLRRAARIIDQEGIDAGKNIERLLAMTELTAREAEIVNLARQGLNNAQIARTLTVSQRTVEGHLYRVFSKLGISERSELDHAGLSTGTPSGETT
ncbi:LuxR C-terminal-related transcriptional regulator [Glutamicibacter sp.]|uniref:LuxR C-terminal-related transcriptional regulator n=1 Tax=Glutamicibacter sp. TaxID=1931995 RepID=UPI002FE3B398